MKVLIFEYITGGGFNKQALPDALLREGRLMLETLLDNFSKFGGVELLVMLDSRVANLINTTDLNTSIITPENDSEQEFLRLTKTCDAVWPIAPEFDGLLQALCQHVEAQDKLLLTTPANTVALTGNKFDTFQQLSQQTIATVPTRLFNKHEPYCAGEWMVKAIDGAGCSDSYLINDEQDWAIMSERAGRFIIQPHLQGQKTSLSCLFKQGRAWLLCVNLQYFDIIDKRYQLTGITVNHNNSGLGLYQNLIAEIACVFPELWGYVGIDLIETSGQILVLEINPRLTTSFTGIYPALGINVAEQVLQLLGNKPTLTAVCNQPVYLKVAQ
ncbi:MAG: ATP-grasp domain-containing protein [Methylovulum sp.]|nr:ATP-grasp domain-containing protein [Methylovulum sp.]